MRTGLLRIALVAMLATLAAGCSSNLDDSTSDTGDGSSNDELRAQSEDLFKPTSSPIQLVPASLAGLVNWEIYVGRKGTTVIGRSPEKKAKAIFVQLFDASRANEIGLRGSGYLLAPDFRFDPTDRANEMRLLGAAIQRDVSSALSDVAGIDLGPPTDSWDASSDPSTTTGAAPNDAAPIRTCARNTMRTVSAGLDLLKDGATIIAGTAACPETVISCAAAVASFSHAYWIVQNFNQLTCQ